VELPLRAACVVQRTIHGRLRELFDALVLMLAEGSHAHPGYKNLCGSCRSLIVVEANLVRTVIRA